MLVHRVQPRCCHHDHESPLTHATEYDQRRPDPTTAPHDALRLRLPETPPKGCPGLPRSRDATRDARLVLPLPEVLRGDRLGSRPETRTVPDRFAGVATSSARSHTADKSLRAEPPTTQDWPNQRSLPKQRTPGNDDPHRSEDHRRPARSGWQANRTGSRRSHTLSRKRGNCLLRRLIPTARTQSWPPLDRPGTSPEADRKRPVPTSRHMRETRHTPGRRSDVATTETSS
jgi:hypothetical protein